MRKLMSVENAVVVILYNLADYQKTQKIKFGNSKKVVTRVRMGIDVLSSCCGRERLDGRFISALQEQLYHYGWLMVKLDNEYYGFLKLGITKSWRRIGQNRISNELTELKDMLNERDDDGVNEVIEDMIEKIDEQFSLPVY